MSIIQLVLFLIVMGVGLWLVNAYIPMAASIKTILNVVIVILVVVVVLNAFGFFSMNLGNVPRIH